MLYYRSITISMGALALLLLSSPVAAAPSVPGLLVQEYANVDTPNSLSFDPSGVLYVGNANNLGNVSIHRVGLGGSPVQDYGAAVRDPDAVLFDSTGSISGIPGSVLVGGANVAGAPPAEGYIVAILPDQSTIPLFGSPTSVFRNPSVMKFDNNGRLVFTDPRTATQGFVFVSTGGVPGSLYDYGGPFTGLAIDGANQIYTLNSTGQTIQIHDSTGVLVNSAFATHSAAISKMAFGPSGAVWGGDLYAVIGSTGQLLRIDSSGTISVIGTGFNSSDGLTFGPHDGQLYVSSLGDNKIYQIGFMPVSIDIKPGREINPVNPRSKGVLKVAILTTEDFDASTVDVSTVRFGPAAAESIRYRLDDVDDDGDWDLVLKFNTQDTGIACGDTEATLTGQTVESVPINGTDSIKTVGCKPNRHHKKKHHKKDHHKKHHGMNHGKHHGDDRDDDERHRGKHKEKEHYERHHSKHHDDDRDDGHKKR